MNLSMLQDHMLSEPYSLYCSLKSERITLRKLYILPFPPAKDSKKQQKHTNFLSYSNYTLGATDIVST